MINGRLLASGCIGDYMEREKLRENIVPFADLPYLKTSMDSARPG